MNIPVHIFGHDPFDLDAAIASTCQRNIHRTRARQYRQDYFSLKRAARVLGMWEACQTGASGWGSLYEECSIPEAMDLARSAWRDELTELCALREERQSAGRVVMGRAA